MNKKFEELMKAIDTESVAYFAYSTSIPKVILDKNVGRVEIFHSKKARSVKPLNKSTKILHSLNDISRYGSSVCFLDNEASKVLLAKYPNSARYVLYRLKLSSTTIFDLVGLLRRIRKGAVAIDGVCKFQTGNARGSTRWLVLRNTTTQVKDPIYLSLSEEVGIAGLVRFLNEANISYVVPRFFEQFPLLHRPDGGDVDLLVDDKDAAKVRQFLKVNPGMIPVDLHTVFGPAPGSGDMPYYIPKLALSMLKNYERGPLDVKIPNKNDYFLSFLYHILFHKGFFSGVDSQRYPTFVNSDPENNYGEFASKLGKACGVELENTMESFENELAKHDYIPKLDTLSAISRINKWVRLRYFGSAYIEECGLSVLILKKIAHKNGWVPSIEAQIENQGFRVIRHKLFSEDEVVELSSVLRGGNWYVNTENKSDYLPQSVYVLLDENHGGYVKAASGKKETRIRLLKTALRSKLDSSLYSFVHATDDTAQSWEYISDIWPDEISEFESIINAQVEVAASVATSPSLGTTLKTKMHIIKERIKQRILDVYE